MATGRNILICAEDTDAAALACQWAVDHVLREGDKLHLAYVVKALLPPMEIFHGPPGTAYAFKDPAHHDELHVIEKARAALEARFVPILTPKMVRYELHLFAEKRETPAQRVGEIILRCAEERDAALVVMATHNKPAAKDKYETYMGSVAQYIMAQCKCPLAVVPPTL